MSEEGILDHEEEEENPGYYNSLNAPYIAGFSERFTKDLKGIDVGVTFSKDRTLYNTFCRLKPPCSKDMRKNVVYCIGCKSCP